MNDTSPTNLNRRERRLAYARRTATTTKVILYPLASSHAAEMLVSYAPVSRTLFQGDLFYLPEVGNAPATFEGGEELSRRSRPQWRTGGARRRNPAAPDGLSLEF